MAKTTTEYPKFGEICYADLPFSGSVQGGIRPVLIVQNDTGNRHSTTIEVLPLSARVTKASHMPTHVFLSPSDANGLKRDSVVLAENVITVPKAVLLGHVGFLDELAILQVAAARAIQSPLPYADCT